MINVRNYKLVSDQVDYDELSVIVRELYRAINEKVVGSVVEMGCYNGTTSLFLRRVLDDTKSDKELRVYDSFSGLPTKSLHDASLVGEQFIAGELAAKKQEFIKNFRQAGLVVPTIFKSWFKDLKRSDIPESISFAFLDGDFYESIRDCLNIITPSLNEHSVIIVDDYQSEALPGAKKATDEWAALHDITIRTEQSLAILRFNS